MTTVLCHRCTYMSVHVFSSLLALGPWLVMVFRQQAEQHREKHVLSALTPPCRALKGCLHESHAGLKVNILHSFTVIHRTCMTSSANVDSDTLIQPGISYTQIPLSAGAKRVKQQEAQG